MLTDYHLHLRPDDPGTDAAEYFTGANADRYRAVAEERGVTELGCSEHVYRFAQALEVWQHPLWRETATDDIDDYAGFVREHTDLKLGIEADFVAGREDRMATLLDSHDWDYVVGSVHFVGEHAVDHDGYEIWDHRSQRPDELWRRYFRTLGEAARTGMFDILAHPDLVKIWGARRPVPDGDLRRFYELAMDGIAESQIAIEVSTAGLRKPVGELYPSQAFLEMCIDAGCPVALSSDAHVPGDVARDYDKALKLLDAVGVRELAVFERRERRLEPIG
ncbi:MAG TPA: histidinol-phosphatase HisJ family protein [Solirubrobacteraceae bacterium]|nr:histidinol-phosphatase HisJ family protein [Solirubrobacteraceae bacterium]